MNERQYELLVDLKFAMDMVSYYKRNSQGDKNVGWKLKKWEKKVVSLCGKLNRAK